jgi:hypothetical protein
MSWWSELMLMLLAAGLWVRGVSHRDEVLGLFVKFLAVVALLVVLVAGRPVPLELGLLGLALWLPSALRFEREGESGRSR